jgi:hypothetical protein
MVEILYIVRDFWHRVVFHLVAMKATPVSCVCSIFLFS